MTPRGRLGLLAFGLFTWSSAMFTAADPITGLVADVAIVQAGMGGLIFAAGLLPGRTARFL